MGEKTRHKEAPAISVSASACGKCILVGEHFVVWGGTALALPLTCVSLTVQLEAEPAASNSVSFADGVVDHRRLAAAQRAMTELVTGPRFSLIASCAADFPAAAGLGASAAFSVAFARALFAAQGRKADEDLVAQVALSMEAEFHGVPSGIDSTVVAFETPCYVKTGTRFVVPTPAESEGPLAGFIDVAPGGVFVLGDTGERSSTEQVVARVADFGSRPKGEQVLERFTGVAESIALQTATALKRGDYEFVGLMFTENHYLLNAIGVSTDRTEELRRAALNAGALGAKLTGAGMGGFVLSVAWPDDVDSVVAGFKKAGAGTVVVQRV